MTTGCAPPVMVTSAPDTGSNVGLTTRPRTTPPRMVATIDARSTLSIDARMVALPPDTPVSAKTIDTWPAGTTTNGGTLAMFGSELARPTTWPPRPAAVPSSSVTSFD